MGRGVALMWVIVILFLLPDTYKVGSDQMIYTDKRTCEVGRNELAAKLTETAPPSGRAYVKCVNMSGGSSA